MKRLLVLGLILAVAGWATVGTAAKPAKKEAKKIRVLLLTGGHGFEEQPFFALFDRMKTIEYKKALLPENADMLKPSLEKDFDCIVRYDMCKTDFTPDEQKAFVELLNTGIGLVSLHHNLGAQKGWDEYRKIIGGKFILADEEIEGQKFTKTPWAHDQKLNVTVVDKKHPITRGVEDFSIDDETYGKFYVAPGVHVLLKTDHPQNNPEIAWTTEYGKSRVFHLMLGHDGKAYANPGFQRLLRQGIRWAATK